MSEKDDRRYAQLKAQVMEEWRLRAVRSQTSSNVEECPHESVIVLREKFNAAREVAIRWKHIAGHYKYPLEQRIGYAEEIDKEIEQLRAKGG